MSIDTSVLGTSMAAAPELAWSLDADDAVLDFPADQPEPDDDEQAPGGRYSWCVAWRRAVLLVVAGAALAAALVSSMGNRNESAPVTAAQSSSADSDPFLREEAGLDVCAYIRSGSTTQQTVEATMQNSSLTLDQARAEVTAAINTYCP
jgi:hypothetical protein